MSSAAARLSALARRPVTWLVAVFVAVPAAVFGVPAAAGATLLVGDNVIQNFPLRVLVGIDLRGGHLPLWDPYLWSGSPLLSAFNAGAAYPTTWLFAVLPGVLAWVVNQALVEIVAATGMLVLLRVLGRSWTASGLGAASFAYGGFMAAQSVHLDVVQAAAWLPWAFAALDRIAHRPEGRSAAPWVALLAATIGLMGLSGAAEPILDGGVVLAVYALWLMWRTPARRLAVLVGAVVGAAVGLLLAGAQLVPGALIQSQSQRAVHDYWYFASGSMNKSLTLLGLDPVLLGANHSFPLTYFGTYNLAEVSGYIGILPVMGIVGLLARRHRHHPEARQWRIWYGILALGLVLAWGDFTPLGHLFFHVPLFDRQRLLSRNLLEVDLAAAVLFAVWVDHMLLPARVGPAGASPADASPAALTSAPRTGGRPAHAAPRGTRGRRRRWRSDVVLALVPAVAVVGLQVVMLAGGTWFPHFLHVPGHVSRASLWPLVAFMTVPTVIALAAAGLVVGRHRVGAVMGRLLAAVVVVDLVVFNLLVQASPDPVAATSAQASWADALAAVVAAQGPGPAGDRHRVALFDPDRFYPVETDRLGEPDLTILRRLASVQGYGAVVAASYDRATGTHLQLNMTPSGLGDGTFARLDLGVLATVPEYFVHLVTAPPTAPTSVVTGSTPLPPVGPSPRTPPDTTAPPPTNPAIFALAPAPAPVVTLAAGVPRTQFFGTVLAVTAVTVPLARLDGPAALRVGLLSPDGRRTTWIGATSTGLRPGGSATVRPPHPLAAGGIVLEALPLTSSAPGASTPAGRSSPDIGVGAAVVRTEGQGTYRVDGALRDAVAPGRWHFVRTIGPFCVFSEAAVGRAWVDGAAGARARIVSDTPWGDETIRVTTSRAATLVRSEQFATGWQATVTAVSRPGATGRTGTGRTGPGRAARVQPAGLLQAVAVPAGTSLVHFTYRPHRVLEGMAVSGAGVVSLVVLGRWPGRRRRAARMAGTAGTAGDG